MECANETHQLLVSVSRHLFVAKHGIIKYQEKPMDVHISNFAGSKKEHLVYYVLQDRFSGNFYFKITSTASFIPLLDFLHQAWKRDKEEDHFWGLPVNLSVPKRISSPELLEGLRKLGVETFHPSSGFASGIRILRDLEDNLCFYLLARSAIHSLDNIQLCKKSIYRYMLRQGFDDNRVELWKESLPPGHPQDVPGYDTFTGCFSAPAKEKAGVRLFKEPGGGLTGNGRQLDFLVKPIAATKYSEEKLLQAEEIVHEAWQFFDWPKRVKLAYDALRLSPYCADAYNLLAEQLMLYRRGIQAGELSLGEPFFKDNRGHFWSLVETRPYMRSLQGLAECLWKKEKREETLAIYREMLELNPGDNQGIRYQLSFRLLDEGRDVELEELFANHDEPTCFMLYNKTLWLFRTGAGDAEDVLRKALQANGHVPAYLLGEEKIPYNPPDYYSLGSIEEAAIYAGEAVAAWRATAGALDWLREQRTLSPGSGIKYKN